MTLFDATVLGLFGLAAHFLLNPRAGTQVRNPRPPGAIKPPPPPAPPARE